MNELFPCDKHGKSKIVLMISAFVKSDRPDKFPNLTIRYVRGLDPIIKLMDKDGNIQEVRSLSKFETNVILTNYCHCFIF